MPTITKEAEKALMEVSRHKSDRITRLLRQRQQMAETAAVAIDDGIKNGSVIWRDALERIVQMARED